MKRGDDFPRPSARLRASVFQRLLATFILFALFIGPALSQTWQLGSYSLLRGTSSGPLRVSACVTIPPEMMGIDWLSKSDRRPVLQRFRIGN
jgi:hypothetical protein